MIVILKYSAHFVYKLLFIFWILMGLILFIHLALWSLFEIDFLSYILQVDTKVTSNDKLLSVLAILIGTQIAGFAVYRNIINTYEIEIEKNKSEKNKSEKVLEAYMRHLVSLAEKQITYFNELEKIITSYSGHKLSTLGIEKTFFSDEVNTIAFIKPIEAMLESDLHKFTDIEMLNFILKIKAKVLELMHNMKILKLLVHHERRDDVLKNIVEIKLEINGLIGESKKIFKNNYI